MAPALDQRCENCNPFCTVPPPHKTCVNSQYTNNFILTRQNKLFIWRLFTGASRSCHKACYLCRTTVSTFRKHAIQSERCYRILPPASSVNLTASTSNETKTLIASRYWTFGSLYYNE